MPFQSPITMSLGAALAPVTHTSTVVSPKDWSVASISTPGRVGLRKNRWKFDVQPVDGFHVGNVSLALPIPGNAMDAELERLAALNSQIVIKVSFNGGTKEDLVVNLTL